MPSSVCRACGVRAVTSLPLAADGVDSPQAHVPAHGITCGHTHTCVLCGDVRVSMWHFTLGHEEHTDLHPCPEGPTLRQVGRVVALENGETTVEWAHYVEDILVDADYWKTRLHDRRRMRLAMVAN